MSPAKGFVAVLSLAALAALGGADTPLAAAGKPLYEATGMVIQRPGEPPELCLGMIALPRVPICGGPRLDGWSWGTIGDEESAEGTTWGDARIVGSYDGEAIAVVAAGPPAPSEASDEDITAGCPEPPGGWSPVDSEKARERHLDRAADAAEEEPDFAGVWVDYYDGNRLILTLAFTGSLTRHERELREHWGGPLCLVRHEHSYAELDAIREEVRALVGKDVLWTSVDVTEGVVEIGAVVVDDATKTAVAARHGEGVVDFEEALERLE